MKTNQLFKVLLVALTIILSACSTKEDSLKLSLQSSYPLHFVGYLPGANYEMKYQLDLEDKYRYRLQIHDVQYTGSWSIDKLNRIVLAHEKRGNTYFLILDKKTIELMDRAGKKIISQLNYTLTKR